MNGYRNLRSHHLRRSGGLAAAGVPAVALLAGCAAPAPDAAPSTSAEATSAPAAPTPDPTASQEAAAAADEAQLPFPADGIAEWASRAVPSSSADGFVFGHSGWLSQNTSPRLTLRNETLAAGSYAVQVACRGEGTLAFAFSTADDQPVAAVDCDNSTTALDVTIPSDGVSMLLTQEGDPVIFALSFQTPPVG